MRPHWHVGDHLSGWETKREAQEVADREGEEVVRCTTDHSTETWVMIPTPLGRVYVQAEINET